MPAVTAQQPLALPSPTSKKTIPSWNDLLFWKSPDWSKIKTELSKQKDITTPSPELSLRPLIETPLNKVRVVLLFPEAYNLPGAANGLALGFNPTAYGNLDKASSLDLTPFLYSRFLKELEHDVKVKPRGDGDLTKWCRQGILLWNSRPTTLIGHSMGHINLPWFRLTEEILETVYLVNPDTVFVFIGTSNTYLHFVPTDAARITLPLPTPARDTVAGSALFSNINRLLKDKKKPRINWAL